MGYEHDFETGIDSLSEAFEGIIVEKDDEIRDLEDAVRELKDEVETLEIEIENLKSEGK